MRFPDELKFSAEDVQAVNVTPHDVHDPSEHDRALRVPLVPLAPIPGAGENRRLFKRLYVRQADLDAHGYSPDCPRCQHTVKHGPNKTQIPHTEACRDRIMAKLRETEAGQRRIAEHEARTNQQMAEQHQQRQEGEVTEMNAPAAQGEIVHDGRAGASSRPAPPPFSELPKKLKPQTVTATGHHHRPRRDDTTVSSGAAASSGAEPSSAAQADEIPALARQDPEVMDMLRLAENIERGVQGAVPPQPQEAEGETMDADGAEPEDDSMAGMANEEMELCLLYTSPSPRDY